MLRDRAGGDLRFLMSDIALHRYTDVHISFARISFPVYLSIKKNRYNII